MAALRRPTYTRSTIAEENRMKIEPPSPRAALLIPGVVSTQHFPRRPAGEVRDTTQRRAAYLALVNTGIRSEGRRPAASRDVSPYRVPADSKLP